jgi:hypothetical protein
MTNETTDLVRLALEESLELGSLKALARDVENVMLLIDCSGSMEGMMKNGRRRIDGLRDVVRDIKNAGHVPMIAFGGPYDAQVRFVDGVPEPDGGTPLHTALDFGKEYGATRVVVISDGMPDLQEASLEAARRFGGRIDVAFVGDPGEGGETFLRELARISGGTQFTGDLGDPKKLSSGVIGLLEGEVDEHAPIQGPGFTTVDAPDDLDTEDEDEDPDFDTRDQEGDDDESEDEDDDE